MSNKLVFKDEYKEVRKAQAIVTSRYKLNPLPLKLITTLISMVQKTDTPEQEYCISVKDFTDFAGLKGNAYYKELDKATDEIMSKPIRVNLGGKDWIKANWCSSIKHKEGEGLIRFKIADELLPYIIDLKQNYLKYDIKNILPLRSEYSIRIYEWLKDEFNTKARYGKSAELILTVEEIRERLEIPNSYEYKDIRVQILDKAKEDLKKHCDIKFEWEIASKIGKKVSHIKFKITRNDINAEHTEKDLPKWLNTFMVYVDFLRTSYKASGKYFLCTKFEDEISYFTINEKGYMIAIPTTGGASKRVQKATAETLYNASYLSALHSTIYRDFINTKGDIWEVSKDSEHKEYWGVLKTEIQTVLKNNDVRVKPMF